MSLSWSLDDNLHTLSSGVFFVTGPASNWVIVRDGSSSLLIDGGYPADFDIVQESLRRAGVSGLPTAVALTHAHVDHLGAALVYASHGVPIWCSFAEVGNAVGTAPEQIDPTEALRLADIDPLWSRWAKHAAQAGGLTPDRLARANLTLHGDGLLDLPGRPISVSTAGHTSGHVAFTCGDVLVAGDALITAHPTSTFVGPQLLHSLFHHSPTLAGRTADHLLSSTSCSEIAPGHGPAISVSDTFRTVRPVPSGYVRACGTDG